MGHSKKINMGVRKAANDPSPHLSVILNLHDWNCHVFIVKLIALLSNLLDTTLFTLHSFP